jgi:hypothetical protein
MVIQSLMPFTLLSGMRREEESESQYSTFSTGVKGGGVGGRLREINGRKIESVGEIVVDAGRGISKITVGAGVTVEVGMVVVTTLVGEEVTVADIVSVMAGVALRVGVLDVASGVASTVVVGEVSSVGVN